MRHRGHRAPRPWMRHRGHRAPRPWMWHRGRRAPRPCATMWRRRHVRSLRNRQTARSARTPIAEFQIRFQSTHPSKPRFASAAATSSPLTHNGVRVLRVDSRNVTSRRRGDARIALRFDTSREVRTRNHLGLRLRRLRTVHGTSANRIGPSFGPLPKSRALSVHLRVRRTPSAPRPRLGRTRNLPHPQLGRTPIPPRPRIGRMPNPLRPRIGRMPIPLRPRIGRMPNPLLRQPTHQGKRRKLSHAAVRSPAGLPPPTRAPRAQGVSSNRIPFRRSSSPRRCLFPPVAKRSRPRSSPTKW